MSDRMWLGLRSSLRGRRSQGVEVLKRRSSRSVMETCRMSLRSYSLPRLRPGTPLPVAQCALEELLPRRRTSMTQTSAQGTHSPPVKCRMHLGCPDTCMSLGIRQH